MADRYSERGGQRWEDSERRFRGRDNGYDDRGFLERFADEVRSWFGDEEAQRRRMMDEREDWRGERGRSDWGWRDAGRGDWGRGEWGRSRRSDWMRGPEEREWSRDWGYVEGRGPGWGRGSYGNSGLGYGGASYGSPSYGSTGYGASGGSGSWEGSWRRDATTGTHAGRGPRNYQRADERIREDVCERLTQHSYLDPSDLDIRVQNGAVTLDGTVTDRWAKRTAEDVAEGVWGVKEVINQIRVTQMEPGQERPEGREDQGRSGPQRGTWAA